MQATCLALDDTIAFFTSSLATPFQPMTISCSLNADVLGSTVESTDRGSVFKHLVVDVFSIPDMRAVVTYGAMTQG